MKVLELYIYPIKSAAAQKVFQLNVTELGPDGDREWLLIDDNGKFITQRSYAKMSQIVALLDAESLTLGIGKMFVKMSLKNSQQRTVKVRVWGDETDAVLEPDLYSQALSQFLGISCRLARHNPNLSKRTLNSVGEGWKPEVRFADSRPISLTNITSLQDLNSRLEVPVEMSRFRPNIVVDAEEPFVEDSWKKIQIGEVIFSQPKPSTRCKIININQKNAEASENAEPLKTLSTYRKREKGVIFGTLWIPENSGLIKENDEVTVLE